MTDTSDNWLAEEEANANAEKEHALKVEQAAREWREKWPNHCKVCGGWGGSHFYQSHPYGSSSASEECFDVCLETERDETCHRCGQDGLTEYGDGPCRFCGWDYDDGEPHC